DHAVLGDGVIPGEPFEAFLRLDGHALAQRRLDEQLDGIVNELREVVGEKAVAAVLDHLSDATMAERYHWHTDAACLERRDAQRLFGGGQDEDCRLREDLPNLLARQ